jgi:hypothetical protein
MGVFETITVMPFDPVNLLAGGPFTLNAGDSVTVAFAFLAGDSLSDLKLSASSARAKFDTAVTNVQELASLPAEFSLSQNYPNPFNPSTTIRFALPTASNVRIEVFNLLGQSVAVLADQVMGAGTHTARWDARVPTGIYFYRLEARPVNNPDQKFVDIKRMVLMK